MNIGEYIAHLESIPEFDVVKSFEHDYIIKSYLCPQKEMKSSPLKGSFLI